MRIKSKYPISLHRAAEAATYGPGLFGEPLCGRSGGSDESEGRGANGW